MSKNRFPIYPAAKVLNPLYSFKCEDLKPILKEISVQYPYRLDAMAINPAAVAYNEDLVFNPGEVTISINKFIKTNLSLLDSEKEVLVISKRTRRKVLVKHAYYLITKLLGVSPSLSIDVDDSDVLKHCGFGSVTYNQANRKELEIYISSLKEQISSAAGTSYYKRRVIKVCF